MSNRALLEVDRSETGARESHANICFVQVVRKPLVEPIDRDQGRPSERTIVPHRPSVPAGGVFVEWERLVCEQLLCVVRGPPTVELTPFRVSMNGGAPRRPHVAAVVLLEDVDELAQPSYRDGQRIVVDEDDNLSRCSSETNVP